MSNQLRCDDCGQFIAGVYSWALIYGQYELDREAYRCATCTFQLGPVTSNAQPADNDVTSYQGIKKEPTK